MERNHSIEKFDQIKWRSSDDQISGSGQAKSYTCTFCKRGFSNAQALGGHMNIHRRDRARIRQFSEDQNQLANNSNSDGMTNKTSSSQHHRANSDEKNSLPLELNETTTVIPARKYPFSMEHDHDVIIVDGANKGKFIGAEEVHQVEFQLPTLFVEDPSGCGGGCRNEETIMKRTEELDLELRLGPEPTETSTSLSTREFF